MMERTTLSAQLLFRAPAAAACTLMARRHSKLSPRMRRMALMSSRAPHRGQAAAAKQMRALVHSTA